MSLTFKKEGLPVAQEGDRIIYVNPSDEADGKTTFEEIQSDVKLKPIPRISTHDRECVLVIGKSGSGKSRYCRVYADQYLKLFPNSVCWIFSKHDKDPAFDDMKRMHRVNILHYTDNQDKYPLGTFKDSIVIFDDIDQIYDVKVLNKLYALRNDILENGRKLFIYCVITKHLFPTGKADKILNVECRSIVFFPQGNKAEIDRYLNKQLLLLKRKRNQVTDTMSRWVQFVNEYPEYVLTEDEIFMID